MLARRIRKKIQNAGAFGFLRNTAGIIAKTCLEVALAIRHIR
jgi:hypothetical protein